MMGEGRGMKCRKLGRTGLMVSCVGFGALPFAGLNQNEARAVINAALDAGVNFVDTARGYKESEQLIGLSAAHRRNEFYLASKSRGRREDKILEDFRTSLSLLKTDRLDLYQVHYVNTPDDLRAVCEKGGALDVFKKLKTRGAVEFIGITGHNAGVLLDAAKTGEFDTVQGAFSYVEKEKPMLDLIEYCAENEIGFIVQKPLAGGAIAAAPACLKWILQHPVSIVIPGMVTVEQVTQNTAVADGPFSLTERERAELDAVAASLDKTFCRRCYYCHPACPENIRIGVILEFFEKAKIPENRALSQRWYRGYTINAANCTECGSCLPECPYGIPIVDMLKEAHAALG
jgi:predicted aldo/keto reductase-like oxidoreductase